MLFTTKTRAQFSYHTLIWFDWFIATFIPINRNWNVLEQKRGALNFVENVTNALFGVRLNGG